MTHIGETLRGNTEGREFVVKTHFARQAKAEILAGDQRSLVIGSLLGDGTLLATTAGWCFRVHHGLRQHELVEWKYNVLRRFVRSEPRVSGRGVYFRTVTHPAFQDLRDRFYIGSRKIVPSELIERELDELALAVWIMDDGAADGKQLRINVQSFSYEEASALMSVLRAKFGIEMRVNSDKGKPRLRCVSSSMERLVEVVRPHFIPSMLYKLSL